MTHFPVFVLFATRKIAAPIVAPGVARKLPSVIGDNGQVRKH